VPIALQQLQKYLKPEGEGEGDNGKLEKRLLQSSTCFILQVCRLQLLVYLD